MTSPSLDQLKRWLSAPAPVSDLAHQVRQSPTTPRLLAAVRRAVPDLKTIPQTTYTDYREFERTGSRPEYQTPYYLKRACLTRALLEYLTGDKTQIDAIHDFAWSICEETTWVLPAHEEQGPDYWEIEPAWVRTTPFGAHTMLTREPDSIDLFAAETGAALAELVALIGDDLAPEVRQRIRQEVERHIFKPYLAHARDHWWFNGALNWNGVCNGSIALAFLRLENDVQTLAEALALALEGFEAYIATGFEADGGSIEGVGYWNYGLMYYVIVAELLREKTGGALDLLAQPRLKAIAAYPPGMTLVAPARFINFGDALEYQPISPGIAQRLAERTGVDQLRALFVPLEEAAEIVHSIAKLPVILRLAAWWDATQPLPAHEQRDFYLPDTGVIKLVGQTAEGKPVILATKSGHNDGHHSHCDVATFILAVDDESLLPDAGRGHYSKQYFRRERYANIFANSYAHNVPRIGGKLQMWGPEFGGRRQYHGAIREQGQRGSLKHVTIDFAAAYDLPALSQARRSLEFDAAGGQVSLTDEYRFDGQPLVIEEAFSTWFPVEVQGSIARIKGERSALELELLEPLGVQFQVENLESACRENHLEGTLSRLSATLPEGALRFRMVIRPR